VGDEELIVQIPAVMKKPMVCDDSCFYVDVIDNSVVDCMQEIFCKDILELGLISEGEKEVLNPGLQAIIAQLNIHKELTRKDGFEKLIKDEEAKLKPSIVEPPVLEMKQLPNYLEYAFLEENSKLPVIIASDLNGEQKG